MTARIKNPPCPQCNGSLRSSNSHSGSRQLKCEDCSYRERRTLVDDTPVPFPAWNGLVKNPPCCKCGCKMHGSNYRDNSRQLKCISCGHRERRVIGTDEIIPNRIYAPKCPVCQGQARRWSNTPDSSNIIKMRCDKNGNHEFSVTKGALEFIAMLPPRIRPEKIQRIKVKRVPKPKLAKLTAEEKAAVKESLTAQKAAKRLADKVYTRAAALAKPSSNKEEIKVVRQREKLIREKIEDQREARIQRDPLFDF